MKKMLMVGFVCMGLFALPGRATCQATELAQLALNIEKLNQFRQILQQMYDAYRIISEGYGKVKDLTSGNYKLHELFLDGLYQVSPSIRKYHRVKDIITYQTVILKEYKNAIAGFRNSKAFSEDQLRYFETVYQRVLDDNLKSLEELVMVITSGQLRMSDDERITAIDRIYGNMKSKMMFVRQFSDDKTLLALEQLREQAELRTIRGLHGLD